MTDPLPTGSLLYATPGVERAPLAAMNKLDPSDAAALTLKAYLEAAVFLVAGSPDTRFQLKRVVIGWPENFQELEYPSASITSPAVQEDAHAFTPTPLEETLDVYGPATVLWKTAEQAIQFQVDFWTTNRLERRGISAQIHELFSPTDTRYGVMLQGPPEYWCLPIRFTLVSHERQDGGDEVQARQRRLRAVVLADVDVVQLRKAVRLEPVFTVDGEPVKLEASAGP